MDFEQLKEKIAQARIDLVFNELKFYFSQNEVDNLLKNKYNELSAAWNELKLNSMLYSDSDKNNKRTRLNYEMLNFLDILDETQSVVKPSSPDIKPENRANNKIRILFLSANPVDTSKLQLDKEYVEINKLLQRSDESDKFELFVDTNITPATLHDAVQKYKPTIFHFSGHGFGTGELNEETRSNVKPPMLSGLMIEDEYGKSSPISQSALDGLFELIAEETELEVVILNACYSAEQAKTIKKHVKNVIGMTDAIGDKSAITFATGFYRALANGKTIENAFKWGKNAIALQNLNEEHKVVLV